MYKQLPPKDALNWHLGLVLEVCFVLGLGKEDSVGESWDESTIADKIARNQVRHWWKSPPKRKRTLQPYIDLVTEREPYRETWRELLAYAVAHNVANGRTRLDVFGVEQFDSNAIKQILMPALAKMPTINQAQIAEYASIEISVTPASRITNRRLKFALLLSLATVAVASSFYFYQASTPAFGNIFQDIRFCLKPDFEARPVNKCHKDQRVFSDVDEKIFLSFRSHEKLDILAEVKLQWFWNGELQIEKARPWADAFAVDQQYASTHLKMKKFEYLPPEFSDPGEYHVRFFLNGEFVDEESFIVREN